MSDLIKELDVSGLNCPTPIMRAKKEIKDLQSGDLLRIITTDPGSVKDFEAFAGQTGNELIESTKEGDSFIYLLKKA